MRLKYYLRGIGAGIVLATIILSISFFFGGGYKNKETLTDEQIIERAKELGMTMPEDASDVEDTTDDSNSISEENETTSVEDEKPIEEYIEEAQNANVEVDETVSYVAFTVRDGESSEVISSNLYKKGLVDDADAFNKYLNKLGVDDRVLSGTFYLQQGCTYDDIVALLVNRDARTTTPPEAQE